LWNPKLNILLIQTPNISGGFFNLPGKEIPLALLYLAGYLKQNGYSNIRLLDLSLLGSIEPHLSKTMAEFCPDIVGLTSYTSNVVDAANIARSVKETSARTVTVLGGFHASALPEMTLREFPEFDYLIFGEGEATFCELVKEISLGNACKERPGLTWRQGETILQGPPRTLIEDLDSIPFPDRSLVPIHKYIPSPSNYFRLPSSGILLSRGCPFRCKYCSKPVFLHRIRFRSSENFLNEIQTCGRDFGIFDFRLEDEGPTANPKKMTELCEEIVRKKLNITWKCFSRIDTANDRLLRLMRTAGCYHVTYGIDSANPATLHRIKKDVNLDQAKQVVKKTRKMGIECQVNFIFGFPWETRKDILNTIRYAMNLSPDLASFNIFRPLPGSELYVDMQKEGKIKHTKWSDYSVTNETLLFDAPFSAKDLRKYLRYSFFYFYFRPSFILQRLVRLTHQPKREMNTIFRGGVILLDQIRHAMRNNPANP